MQDQDFSTSMQVDQSPAEVFKAVTNVRAWWFGYHEEEITGDSEKLNDEFTFIAAGGAHYSKQKLVEVVPSSKVVWLVTDSALSFLDNKSEWTGTKLIFDISRDNGKTRLTFTHKGLVPSIECYDTCTPAWTKYVQNKLKELIVSGKNGNPS